jgi:adenosylcobyric acid synthase
MVVGTASDVGKSLLVTGLCRHFAARGLSVAPFKAQNMSLNAAVTPDGHEIGRAQWVQAEAAGVAPHVDMNPILLKPEGEMRSQVVVMGKPWARLAPRDYYACHTVLAEVVAHALARLRARHDLVILEGAGSPAELNLSGRDVVNMAAARMAEASVILVGDIERGGIFASLLGTLDLLEPTDRARIKGLVVNKFRGDPRLFDEGVRILEQRSRLPVLGVLPHLGELAIADEDSMALMRRRSRERQVNCLDLCVIRTPHMSNFEDVLPLEHEIDVVVRFVEDPSTLADADLVILPGSKSTQLDLTFLRERGFASALHERAHAGKPILGVCGGFQMLGREILDPERIEGDQTHAVGLGLLPVSTRFRAHKTTASVRASATHESYLSPAGVMLQAYEIHMGEVTREPDARPLFKLHERNGAELTLFDGAISADGHVLGTLLHGCLAHDTLRAHLLQRLWALRGRARTATASSFAPAAAYAALAQALETHLDLDRVASWLEPTTR